MSSQKNKLNSKRIEEVKQIIEQSLTHIILYAQKSYSSECCGFVLENGTIIPAQNIIETLYDPSLNSKNAFLISPESWNIARNQNSLIIAIYHSHPNGSADMSLMDQNTLCWPDLCYVIVSIFDTNPKEAKLHWWQDKMINSIDLKI